MGKLDRQRYLSFGEVKRGMAYKYIFTGKTQTTRGESRSGGTEV